MAVVRAQCPNPAHPGPERFGDYMLLGKIGSGGMAEVFLATALSGPRAGRPVALKRLLRHRAEQPRFVDMFLSEAAIASRIDNDHVCRIYDYGDVDGEYFIAMEYLHGGSLGALLTKLSRRRRRLKIRFIHSIFADLCAGLQAAHALGIIHRDVSPNNVFVTVDGVVKVLDFGVAKASFASTRTKTGVVKGTFAYMSPEQLRGRTLDPRTDVFSVGVVLHEALTCRRLFKRDNDYAVCRAITQEPIPRACDLRGSVPVALSNVVDRALARRRQDRYASAAELADALERARMATGQLPDREAIGREIARLFADELEAVDDLVAEQPTRVALARRVHRLPTAPRAPSRHHSGDVIDVLPLRAATERPEEQIDEAHPSERFEAIEPIDLEQAAKLAAPRPASRALRFAAIAVGLLLLASGSQWAPAPAEPDRARPALAAEQPAAEFVGVGEGGIAVDELIVEPIPAARVVPAKPAPERPHRRKARRRARPKPEPAPAGPGALVADEL